MLVGIGALAPDTKQIGTGIILLLVGLVLSRYGARLRAPVHRVVLGAGERCRRGRDPERVRQPGMSIGIAMIVLGHRVRCRRLVRGQGAATSPTTWPARWPTGARAGTCCLRRLAAARPVRSSYGRCQRAPGGARRRRRDRADPGVTWQHGYASDPTCRGTRAGDDRRRPGCLGAKRSPPRPRPAIECWSRRSRTTSSASPRSPLPTTCNPTNPTRRRPWRSGRSWSSRVGDGAGTGRA